MNSKIPNDVREHLREHMRLIKKYGEQQLERWEKDMGVNGDKESHFPAARKMMMSHAD